MQKNGTKCSQPLSGKDGQPLSGKDRQLLSGKDGQLLSGKDRQLLLGKDRQLLFEQSANKSFTDGGQLICADTISMNCEVASVNAKVADKASVDTKVGNVAVDSKRADVVIGEIIIATEDVSDSAVSVAAEQKKKKVITVRAKNKTKVLTYAAMLVALSVICNIFDVPLGIGDLKISFSYIPTMVAGVFMGPYVGLAVGLIGDVLGLLIKPQGPWIPLITLGSALMGLIPGLIFMIKKGNPYFKLAVSFVAVFLICTCTINSIGIFLTYMRGKKTFWVWMFTSRLPAQPIIVAVNAVLLFSIYYPLKKYVFAGKFSVK